MKPTAQIILYKSRVKKNGKYPVKIRVVFQRDHKDYKLGIDMTQVEFDEAMKSKPSKLHRVNAAKLTEQQNKANKLIEFFTPFTFLKFESGFLGQQKDANNIFPLFDEYIANLKAEDRLKTATAYQTAANMFKTFHSKTKLSFYDISPSFLNKFQKWMIDKERSSTTVGIYSRALRTIYNYGISKGIIRKDESYPFGKTKFIIPAGRNIKKALTMDEIKKIYDYQPIGTIEDRSKNYWLFSYYCNGINFRDIAELKGKNIDGDMLRFVREKTKRTSQGNQSNISCYLIEQAKEIIRKLGNINAGPNDYVFPILSKGDSSEVINAKVAQLIQTTNKNMKRICGKLELKKNVTTYYARHSSATILKRSGASISQIQEALGHSNSAVTQKYLDSFEDETKKDLAKALIPK